MKFSTTFTILSLVLIANCQVIDQNIDQEITKKDTVKNEEMLLVRNDDEIDEVIERTITKKDTELTKILERSDNETSTSSETNSTNSSSSTSQESGGSSSFVQDSSSTSSSSDGNIIDFSLKLAITGIIGSLIFA